MLTLMKTECNQDNVLTWLFPVLSGLPPSWAPARPAAWRTAPWRAPCLWVPTCRTASVASPTRPAWSASPVATSTVTPAVTRSSTWPSRTSRACLTTPAPCANPSASSEAWVRPPPGTSLGPTASCRSVRNRSTGVAGGQTWSSGIRWKTSPSSDVGLKSFAFFSSYNLIQFYRCGSYMVALKSIKSYFILALLFVVSRWNVRMHDIYIKSKFKVPNRNLNKRLKSSSTSSQQTWKRGFCTVFQPILSQNVVKQHNDQAKHLLRIFNSI